jgi:hypothetical protein
MATPTPSKDGKLDQQHRTPADRKPPDSHQW